jgi:2-hydroxy-6-oxonona-2,4-dienedioate hydrolase
MPTQLTSRWGRIHGYHLYTKASVAEATGTRPAVALVHGLSVSHRYWTPTAELLADHFEVFMPDLPGFGNSEKPKKILTIPQLADVLLEWMQFYHLERPILMGNSLGCQVVAELQRRSPGCFSCAVLTTPTMDPSRRSLPAAMFYGLLDAFHEPPRLLWIVFQDYLRAGPRRTIRSLQYAVRDRIEDKLPGMDCPVLVVRGEQDYISSERWVERAEQLLPQGKLALIPDAGHGVIYSQPEALVEAVRAFLKGDR